MTLMPSSYISYNPYYQHLRGRTFAILFGGLVFCLCCSPLNGQSMVSNLSEAKTIAHETDKKILLIFSGSDWCKPCIQLKKEILKTSQFQSFADSNLIILIADFPYSKKKKLSKSQEAHNAGLADKFNPNGDFPKIVLLDEDETVIETIRYNKGMRPSHFINTISKSM